MFEMSESSLKATKIQERVEFSKKEEQMRGGRGWSKTKIGFTCTIMSCGGPLWGEVTLPIEVMGAPPHVETINLVLDQAAGVLADRVTAQVHNVSYEDKARIRVNGGNWISIWNDRESIDVSEPARSYGGFGGGFSSVRFTIAEPEIQLNAGANTIDFQYFHKHPEHPTAGYRVVSVNILDAQGNVLLPEETFREEDPSLWEPPLDNAQDIAAGESIWRYADLGMEAKCRDCHADDGRDLKYFNVSNKTIIEQCKKSGFSELEGKQVASYIRSLPFDAPDGARPWNPPYQPGPGTDSRPVFEWAAGAGLDAVLQSDREMLPYLFAGASQQEIDAVTDLEADLNLREMPIAVQLPDWIHWIPRVHPADVWGKTWWETAKGEKPITQSWRNPHEAYLYLRDQFVTNDLANSQNLLNTVDNQFQRNVLWWIGDARSGHPWTDKDGSNLDRAISRGFTAEEAKLHLSRWRAVKLWELFHTFEAEDKIRNSVPKAEHYQWPTNYFATFQIAAHFIGDDRGTSVFAWESLETGTYFSSIWYQLQMVLNCGMHQGMAVSPVDWAYNFYHVNRLGRRTGVYEPLRLVQNLIKCYQQRHRPGEPIKKEVWSMREVSPWRHYSDFDGDQTTYALLNSYDDTGDLRQRIHRSLLKQFLRGTQDYAPSDWPRTDMRNTGGDFWFLIESENYIPQLEPDEVTDHYLFSVNGERDAIEADAMYRLIPRLYETGIEPALVNELADWCASVWPLPDWQMWATDSDGDRLHDYWEGLRFKTLEWGPDDDPDGNGFGNLQEYASGYQILGIQTQPQLESSVGNSRIQLIYYRPVFRDGLACQLESSIDLNNWFSPASGDSSISTLFEIYERVTEIHDLPVQNNGNIYYRLKVLEQ